MTVSMTSTTMAGSIGHDGSTVLPDAALGMEAVPELGGESSSRE
ncbi:MAG TPA: hypothetical protein PKC22_03375 [Rhodocyclaceae bacterium]|nr:hypothetical protein [Rhodocyclaceae bacterium]